MTLEEKAKAYDEALDKARKLYNSEETSADVEIACENIFPELIESEDERIRKEIIDFLELPHPQFLGKRDHKKWLAWLEKQGESIKIKKGKTYLCTKTHKFAGEEWIEGIKYYSPEDYSLVNQGCTYYCPEYSKEEHNNFFKEEYAEIKPKFKVGDWIVDKGSKEIFHVEKKLVNTYEIVDVEGNDYHIPNYILEEDYDVWTIQDANDGDVLAASDGSIFLFAGVVDCACKYYVALTSVNDVKINKEIEGGYWETSRAVHPATKEQRDLLFQKMKEAGYEWDAEKKELKKIENKEYNGEDYGIDSLYHAQRILEKTLGKVDGYQSDDGILEHKCAITAIKKLYKQKPAWSEEEVEIIDWLVVSLDSLKIPTDTFYLSKVRPFLISLRNKIQPIINEWSEEDEKMCQETIDWFEKKCFPYALENDNPARESINWLKSLKQRYTWKPSDEQMRALEHFVRSIGESGYASSYDNNTKLLYSLLEQLKKLREE